MKHVKVHNYIFLILSVSLLFLLTGCSATSKNIENYYYVVAVGIDKAENNQISLTVQIATSETNSSSNGSSQSSTSAIYSTECSSINSGISILDNFLSKKLNFSHCSAIIFSEEIAKLGIEKYINTFSNNFEIRPNSQIIISNTTSKETLECISNSSEPFSAKLYEFIINSVEYTGYSINPELGDFFFDLNSDIHFSTATYANISDGLVQNTGIAIFNKDKFLTNLTVLDSIAYSLITNKINTCTISIEDPFIENEIIDISIHPREKAKINISLVNGYPYIQIKNKLRYTLESASSSFNYEDTKNIQILEKHINSYIEDICLSLLYKISHEYNKDICNFQNTMSSQYLTYDDFEKINWNEIYRDSFFKVIINGSIQNSGLFIKE